MHVSEEKTTLACTERVTSSSTLKTPKTETEAGAVPRKAVNRRIIFPFIHNNKIAAIDFATQSCLPTTKSAGVPANSASSREEAPLSAPAPVAAVPSLKRTNANLDQVPLNSGNKESSTSMMLPNVQSPPGESLHQNRISLELFRSPIPVKHTTHACDGADGEDNEGVPLLPLRASDSPPRRERQRWFESCKDSSSGPALPLPSILKKESSLGKSSRGDVPPRKVTLEDSNTVVDDLVPKISSIDSDIPSLASSRSSCSSSSSLEDSPSSVRVTCTPCLPQPPTTITPLQLLRSRQQRCFSETYKSLYGSPHTQSLRESKITFDPHIWVREFYRCKSERNAIWYSSQELETFKMAALTRIMKDQSGGELMPTGTGRVVQRPHALSRAFFSHRALGLDSDSDDDGDEDSESGDGPESANMFGRQLERTKFLEAVVAQEIRNVLVVDPHDLCQKLFAKTFQTLLPDAQIVTVSSSAEAIKQIQLVKEGDSAHRRRFDIILVEERLNIFHRQLRSQVGDDLSTEECSGQFGSGSALLKHLATAEPRCVLVGVSAHIKADAARLRASGADFCWAKPPPRMDHGVRNELIQKLLVKRGRRCIADQLFT